MPPPQGQQQQYYQQQYAPPPPPPKQSGGTSPVILVGAGVVLAVAGMKAMVRSALRKEKGGGCDGWVSGRVASI